MDCNLHAAPLTVAVAPTTLSTASRQSRWLATRLHSGRQKRKPSNAVTTVWRLELGHGANGESSDCNSSGAAAPVAVQGGAAVDLMPQSRATAMLQARQRLRMGDARQTAARGASRRAVVDASVVPNVASAPRRDASAVRAPMAMARV